MSARPHELFRNTFAKTYIWLKDLMEELRVVRLDMSGALLVAFRCVLLATNGNSL
jgi:hypothetical protein